MSVSSFIASSLTHYRICGTDYRFLTLYDHSCWMGRWINHVSLPIFERGEARWKLGRGDRPVPQPTSRLSVCMDEAGASSVLVYVARPKGQITPLSKLVSTCIAARLFRWFEANRVKCYPLYHQLRLESDIWRMHMHILWMCIAFHKYFSQLIVVPLLKILQVHTSHTYSCCWSRCMCYSTPFSLS